MRASIASALPELGVGITYTKILEPLLLRAPSLFDLIEIEPQTMWLATNNPARPYLLPRQTFAELAALPFKKLVHSVGVPVGGGTAPHPAQIALLNSTIEILNSPWTSDHLSFNSTAEFHTGFFLPPRQTHEGVAKAAATIRALAGTLPVPLAVETGVNYLKPRRDELPDGEYIRAVVEEANCGLLLDLHNIFANAANGRQPIERFLAQIPFERIWEVHIAGGMEMDGFWLDSHSGRVPEALLKVAADVIPMMPNLKAIVFEIFPTFVERAGLDVIEQEIIQLRTLWDSRTRIPAAQPDSVMALRDERHCIHVHEVDVRETDVRETDVRAHEPAPDSGEWEQTLGNLVIGWPMQSRLGEELAQDSGVLLMRQLIHELRAAMVLNIYRLTARYLMLALSPELFERILHAYWDVTPPHLYAIAEASKFAHFLRNLALRDPVIYALLDFEESAIATLTDNQPRTVRFEFDPTPLLQALARSELPTAPGAAGLFQIELTPESADSAIGFNLDAFEEVLPLP